MIHHTTAFEQNRADLFFYFKNIAITPQTKRPTHAVNQLKPTYRQANSTPICLTIKAMHMVKILLCTSTKLSQLQLIKFKLYRLKFKSFFNSLASERLVQ